MVTNKISGYRLVDLSCLSPALPDYSILDNLLHLPTFSVFPSVNQYISKQIVLSESLKRARARDLCGTRCKSGTSEGAGLSQEQPWEQA